jgi:PAS domain S-box-containing protein
MSKATIFIVEDSIIVSLHLQKTLESENYRVIGTADSGLKAIEKISEVRPDLVLMDIMLNGEMDGIETASILKDKFNVPVVYITALTDTSTIQRAKITEPYGYLTKPFEDREIFTVIEIALYKFETESKLKRSEEKFFSTLKSISDGVITIDTNYCISYINPSAEILTGHLSSECLGKSLFEMFLLRDTQTGEFPVNPMQCKLDSRHENVLPDGLTLISKSGKEIPIGESGISPIIDYKGNSTGFVITFKDISDKIEREKLVEISERRKLAAQIEGQENERKRIAKDLHDGLGQMLSAIKMNVNIVTDNPEKSRDLNKLLDEAIQETKRISENLLPSKIRDFGLVPNLKTLCQEVEQATRIPVAFHKLGEISKLTDVAKINLYRIAQEGINNAVRHGQPSHIVVQLNEDDDKLTLTIEDDGKGFNPEVNEENSRSKNGLVNMRDRTRILNGTITIESDTNRGTLIMVEAPLEVIKEIDEN